MSQEYILSIDLGTTGCKVGVFDKDGGLKSLSYSEYPLYTNTSGWAEQDPIDWWNAVKQRMKSALLKANIPPSSIKAIGVTGQSTSVVFLGKKGTILRPAILYMDARAEHYLPELFSKIKNMNYVEMKFYSNLIWLRDNDPNLYEKIEKVIDAKEFIAMKLTGRVTYDTFVLSPDRVKMINEHLDIPDSFFGEPHDYKEPTGYLSEDISRELGIPEGTPIVVGPWDGMCNVLGSGLTEDGIAMDVAGTTEIVAVSSKNKTDAASYRHLIENLWLAYTSLPLAISYRWFRDKIAIHDTQYSMAAGMDAYNILNLRASQSKAGAAGLLFIPTMQGDFMKPHLSGAFIGLRTTHTLNEMARAIMEGIAYHLRWMIERIEEGNVTVNEIRVSGGGAKSSLWNKIKADVLNKPVKILDVVETGCLGATILTSTVIGWYSNLIEASQAMIHIKETITPEREQHEFYNKLYKKYREAFDFLDDFFSE